jgi:ceramide glucosyltransferase
VLLILEKLVGASLLTHILFISALVFVIGDILATLFTIFYQKYWYERILRPKFGNSYNPRCSIIVPCKGIPKDLGNNLAGFLELDYNNYEVIFVVESEKDTAVEVIKSIIKGKENAKLVIAGLTSKCAQKNHNLLAAIKNVSEPEVYVFADSDIRPDGHWLRELTIPLADKKITVTSGFRWLHATNCNAGEMTHAYVNVFMYILFCVACFFGGVGLWGGSMAMRKKDFDELGVAEKWSKTVVDDMSLSQIVMKQSRKAVVVPPCISHSDDLLQTVKGTVTWFERQIMFLKSYQKSIWFFVAFPASLLVLFLLFLLPVAVIVSIFGNHTFFGSGGGAALVFYVGELLTVCLYPLLGSMPRFHKFLVMQPLMRFMQIWSYLRTFGTNTVTWAGIKYHMKFSGEVGKIERPSIDI